MLTLISLLALLSFFSPKRLGWLPHVISFIGYGSMCVFVGLRDHVGDDWVAYDSMFRDIGSSSFFGSFAISEPLYAICNKLVFILGGDVHELNLLCAVILFCALFNFARLVDIDPNLILLISTPYLLFVVAMNYNRQAVAVGLCFNAIGYLRHNKLKEFYGLAIIAVLFHYSAIFLILLWWLRSVKRLILLSFILAFAWPIIARSVVYESYASYLAGNTTFKSDGVWSRVLFVLLGLLVAFIQRSKWREEIQLRKMLFRCLIGMAVIVPLSFIVSTVADRLCLYLLFAYVLGMGSLVKNTPALFRYFSFVFIVCFSFATCITWFSLSKFAAASWLPYGNSLCGSSELLRF
jgi:hypothetical protein